MITDTQYFSDKLNLVYDLIYKEEDKILTLPSFHFTKFDESEIRGAFNSLFSRFPFEIMECSTSFGISINATEVLDCECEISNEQKNIPSKKISKIKARRESFNPNNWIDLFGDYFSVLFQNLIYDYSKFLENTKKYHFFANINDEKIILLNLLKRYRTVISDSTKQIQIFYNLLLSKEASDVITQLLIDFIEQRLNLLNISYEEISKNSKISYVSISNYQIKWNGTQQQLCELFIELENKNWIEGAKYGDGRSFVKNLVNIFNLENTQRKPNSDVTNSLYQIFKGETIKGKKIFPFLEKEDYIKSFENIVVKSK